MASMLEFRASTQGTPSTSNPSHHQSAAAAPQTAAGSITAPDIVVALFVVMGVIYGLTIVERHLER